MLPTVLLVVVMQVLIGIAVGVSITENRILSCQYLFIDDVR